MSYTPTTWTTGDTITASALNKIEQGIADGGGGGSAVVQLSATGYTTGSQRYGLLVYGIYDEQYSRWVVEQDDDNYWVAICGFANDAPKIIPPYLTIIPNDNIGLFFIAGSGVTVTTTGDIVSESALYYSWGSLVANAYRITGDCSISLDNG